MSVIDPHDCRMEPRWILQNGVFRLDKKSDGQRNPELEYLNGMTGFGMKDKQRETNFFLSNKGVKRVKWRPKDHHCHHQHTDSRTADCSLITTTQPTLVSLVDCFQWTTNKSTVALLSLIAIKNRNQEQERKERKKTHRLRVTDFCLGCRTGRKTVRMNPTDLKQSWSFRAMRGLCLLACRSVGCRPNFIDFRAKKQTNERRQGLLFGF